jgi:hypothetical protein
MYWRGQFGDLSAAVPPLLAGAKAAHAAYDGQAAGLLAQSYQLTACLLVQMGSDDMAFAAARSAWRAATAGHDDLQRAAVEGTLSWILLHMTRNEEAERVARLAAERIEPRNLRAPKARLAVYGALLLSAAAPAAARGNADAVAGYLGAARAAALGFTRDRHDYQVSFGRTQVAMQATYNYAVLEEPGKALAAAANVRRDDLLRISWGAHQLDVALANLIRGRNQAALEALRQAYEVSAEWWRHQGVAREVTAELVRRARRLDDGLRELKKAAGVP